MSLKTTPGFGKSGMSRMSAQRGSSTSSPRLQRRLPFLRGRGGMLVGTGRDAAGGGAADRHRPSALVVVAGIGVAGRRRLAPAASAAAAPRGLDAAARMSR